MAVRVLLDDAFLNLRQTGIARFWSSWIAAAIEDGVFAEFGVEPVLLNRSDQLAGLAAETVDFPELPVGLFAEDRRLLSNLVATHAIDITASSYYTFSYNAPSFVVVYDLIPELLGFARLNRGWIERSLAFAHASGFACISDYTESQLREHYPHTRLAPVSVAKPGLDQRLFSRRSDEDCRAFQDRYGLQPEYWMMVGSRYQQGGYKNGQLVVEAMEQGSLPIWDVVFVGGEAITERESKAAAGLGIRLVRVELTDEELACAFSGARALVYPSKLEGFGLPPLEALACGTPVVTTSLASLPESVGALSLWIGGDQPEELASRLRLAAQPRLREYIAKEGPAHAGRYQWGDCARTIVKTICDSLERASNDPFIERRQELLRQYNELARDLQTDEGPRVKG